MLEGKRISELETVTNLQTGCCFPVLSAGTTKRITFGSLLSQIENNLPETGIEEVKEDVATLKNRADETNEKINNLNIDVENVKTEVADVDEIVQGQNATIRNCVSTVNTLEQIIEQTHFEDVLALEEQVRKNSSVIPTQASTQNQLADKNFVNSTVGTNTANYISDDGEPFTSVDELEAYSGTVTNNDYAFVTGTDSDGNVYFDRYKASVSGENVTWGKEYRLNNSSFTAEQWAAINSGVTSDNLENKQDKLNTTQLKAVNSGITAEILQSLLNATNVPTGTIQMYAGSNAPAGYLMCWGQPVHKDTYPELFNVIGTTYGSAGGEGFFQVPDLRGRFAEGASGSDLGANINAGLPNITGATSWQSNGFYAGTWGNARADNKQVGSFSISNSGKYGGIGSSGSDKQGGIEISFNASTGETKTDGTIKTTGEYHVYGKSDTVQPPALKVNYIIKY